MFEKKKRLYSFLIGLYASANNDLSAVEYTQTDRVTRKNWDAFCKFQQKKQTLYGLARLLQM